jgi:predicted nucleotidyltransferase
MASPTKGCDLSQVDLPDSARAAMEALARFDGVERIILFGSRAIGDHDRRSDIDVAISGVGIDRAMLAKIRDWMDRARTLYKISIADLDAMPKPLRERVLTQGLTIYERPEA